MLNQQSRENIQPTAAQGLVGSNAKQQTQPHKLKVDFHP